jgi:PleD family two-component response regulator
LNPDQIKILIITEDPLEGKMLSNALGEDSYQVFNSADGNDAFNLAHQVFPQLFILAENPGGIDANQFCRQLRSSLRFASVPILMVTNGGLNLYSDEFIDPGADDYLVKPINPRELNFKIKTLLARTRQYIHASPLTGLPGNPDIEIEIRRRLQEGEDLAVAYIDIDYFKSYNDSYGWLAGDNVIRKTAGIILDVVERVCGEEGYIGHLGGDDFITIMPTQYAEVTARELIANFDREISEFYPDNDFKRGYIIQNDRQGNLFCFPLLSISIAICTNRHRELVHPGQVAQIGIELKEHLKSKLGSNYLIDRRSSTG